MQPFSTCLWFDDQAEEAANLYVKTFGGKITARANYTEASAKQAGREVGSTMTVSFEIANRKVLALNGGPIFKISPSLSFYVGCETEDEIERLWKTLSPGGTVTVPLDKYPWAPKYAWTSDKYGVQWQLILGPRAQKIAPAFFFSGANLGRGKDAIDFYTSVFPDSRVDVMAQDPNSKNVMHASFTLANQPFVLMEGPAKYPSDFSEGASIIVSCDTQKEIDMYWEKLTAGGSPGPCGWLKDRFGVSWQVNPAILEKLATDPAKMAKAMTVVMKSKKLNIADIETAANS